MVRTHPKPTDERSSARSPCTSTEEKSSRRYNTIRSLETTDDLHPIAEAPHRQYFGAHSSKHAICEDKMKSRNFPRKRPAKAGRPQRKKGYQYASTRRRKRKKAQAVAKGPEV